MNLRKIGVVELVIALAVAACGGPGSATHATATPSAAGEVELATELTRRVQRDLSRRIGVAADHIVVTSVEPVQWADTSLGCPQPGVVYAQVVVPGYRIEVTARGETYAYHTDLEAQLILCSGGENPPAVTPRPGDIDDANPWMPVY